MKKFRELIRYFSLDFTASDTARLTDTGLAFDEQDLPQTTPTHRGLL